MDYAHSVRQIRLVGSLHRGNAHRPLLSHCYLHHLLSSTQALCKYKGVCQIPQFKYKFSLTQTKTEGFDRLNIKCMRWHLYFFLIFKEVNFQQTSYACLWRSRISMRYEIPPHCSQKLLRNRYAQWTQKNHGYLNLQKWSNTKTQCKIWLLD